MSAQLTLLLWLAITSCDASRSFRVSGKSATLAASAPVPDCSECPACGHSSRAKASSIKWSVYPDSEDGLGPLRAGGGPILPNATGWSCTYTAPQRVGDHETVELDCVFDKARVAVIALCEFYQGSRDVQSLHVGEQGAVVIVACEAR